MIEPLPTRARRPVATRERALAAAEPAAAEADTDAEAPAAASNGLLAQLLQDADRDPAAWLRDWWQVTAGPGPQPRPVVPAPDGLEPGPAAGPAPGPAAPAPEPEAAAAGAEVAAVEVAPGAGVGPVAGVGPAAGTAPARLEPGRPPGPERAPAAEPEAAAEPAAETPATEAGEPGGAEEAPAAEPEPVEPAVEPEPVAAAPEAVAAATEGVAAPAAGAEPTSERNREVPAEQVPEAGPAPADLDAWQATVRERTQATLRPPAPPDPAAASAALRARAAAVTGREGQRRAGVVQEVRRAVRKAPPMPEDGLPEPKPLPVPEAEAAVKAAVGKRLSAQTLPTLEAWEGRYPKVQAQLPPEAGLVLRPPEPPPAPTGDREGAAKVKAVREAGKDVTERPAAAGPLVLDVAAPPQTRQAVAPRASRTDILGVLGQLQVSLDHDAQALLAGVRRGAYPNGALETAYLMERLPPLGDKELLPQVKTAIQATLTTIGERVGITAAELDRAAAGVRPGRRRPAALGRAGRAHRGRAGHPGDDHQGGGRLQHSHRRGQAGHRRCGRRQGRRGRRGRRPRRHPSPSRPPPATGQRAAGPRGRPLRARGRAALPRPDRCGGGLPHRLPAALPDRGRRAASHGAAAVAGAGAGRHRYPAGRDLGPGPAEGGRQAVRRAPHGGGRHHPPAPGGHPERPRGGPQAALRVGRPGDRRPGRLLGAAVGEVQVVDGAGPQRHRRMGRRPQRPAWPGAPRRPGLRGQPPAEDPLQRGPAGPGGQRQPVRRPAGHRQVLLLAGGQAEPDPGGGGGHAGPDRRGEPASPGRRAEPAAARLNAGAVETSLGRGRGRGRERQHPRARQPALQRRRLRTARRRHRRGGHLRGPVGAHRAAALCPRPLLPAPPRHDRRGGAGGRAERLGAGTGGGAQPRRHDHRRRGRAPLRPGVALPRHRGDLAGAAQAPPTRHSSTRPTGRNTARAWTAR